MNKRREVELSLEPNSEWPRQRYQLVRKLMDKETEHLARELFDALGFNPDGEWEDLLPSALEAEKILAAATVTAQEIRLAPRTALSA